MIQLVEEIVLMIQKSCNKEVEENRKRLAPIIDTAILFGRLVLAFRGHRDDSQSHPNVGKYSSGDVGSLKLNNNFWVSSIVSWFYPGNL